MLNNISKLIQSARGRYLIVGGSVYALELVIIYFAQKAGASAVIAVSFSFWIGLVVSFILQKLVTFQDRQMHHKILIPQIIAVSLLVVFNFGFTIFVTNLISFAPPTVTRTIALLITTVWNFYLYKTRIFTGRS